MVYLWITFYKSEFIVYVQMYVHFVCTSVRTNGIFFIIISKSVLMVYVHFVCTKLGFIKNMYYICGVWVYGVTS